MSKILILTPQMPYPPEQGTSLRNYHILRGLISNHQVSLLSYNESEEIAETPPELSASRLVGAVPVPRRTSTGRLIKLFSSRQPDLSHRLRSSEFEAILRGELTGHSHSGKEGKSYDTVQIEGLELAHTIPIVRRFSPQSRIVLDEHNAESELQQRALDTDTSSPDRWPAAAYSWVQVARLRRFEAWACRSADWVTVVSDQDYNHLQALVPGLRATVVPSCIDVEAYRKSANSNEKKFDLLFTGKMDYRPNVDAVLWFAQKIWPIVRAVRPSTTWAVVGKRPHRRLRSIKALDGVTVTGWVDHVPPYMSGAKVFIMPFRIGSGTRLKLIEAMATGKAIVSTRLGAEGFDIEHNKEMLLEDEPEGFAEAILKLLDQPEERSRLGMAAELHAQRYDWRVVIPKFDEIYLQLGKMGSAEQF